MKRIFIEQIKIGDHTLNKENLNYLTKTLRFKGGEKILVFDGNYEAEAVYKDKKIEIAIPHKEKETTFLKLAIAEIQKERLEWIIEKATELGVKQITLLKTKRTQKTNNLIRLEKITIAACKQSRRISLPNLKQNILSEFIASSNSKEWIFGSTQTTESKIKTDIVGAIIGPEGGWTKEEENLLNQKFKAIFLNQNILRSETAAITALNYINFSKNKSHIKPF